MSNRRDSFYCTIAYGLVLAMLLPIAAMSATNRPAKVVSRAHAYPSQMIRMAQIDGIVRLQVQVLASGAPGEIETIWPPRGSVAPDWPLVDSARFAAQASVYDPAYVDGVSVDSILEVTYEFKCANRCGENACAFCPQDLGSRARVVDNPSPRICIMGHWLQGPIEIRMNDTRVYVGGIRVFPSALDFNGTELRIARGDSLFAERLRAECHESLQEMAACQYSTAEIADVLVAFLEGVPGVFSVDGAAPPQVTVTLDTGLEFLIDIRESSKRPGYCEPGQLAKLAQAEEIYHKWLTIFMDGRGHLWKPGLETSADEVEIEAYFESGGAVLNAAGGFDWPEGLGGQPIQHFMEDIRKPAWVFRI